VAVADYDEIGVGYARHRQPDPRLAAQFERALGEASTVLNVGAGTGSYESVDRAVVAVEPSAVMAAQRPAGAAPVLRAVVEQLPFAGETFDAATMFLTLHHWADWRVGLREVRRVARRLVIFTFEPGAHAHCWVVRALPDASVEVVPVPHDCTDGFLWAYWRRPEQYLDPAVRRGISAIAQLPPQDVEPGMARLAADLESGRWHDEHADLLDLDEVDGGFRLVVAG
jgi:SAM-dependent methyltransferase